MREARLTLSLADQQDREVIYAIRHDVYASELGQHSGNAAGMLKDRLDEINTYIVAKLAGTIAGFVSLTPPNEHGYSLDKYFRRSDLPLVFDDHLHEVRLLTVTKPARNSSLAALLMYAAMRYLESRGATTIAAIGRLEIKDLYTRIGLRSLGMRTQSGAVTYELMAADTGELRAHLESFGPVVERLERSVRWEIPGVPGLPARRCYHGGAFFSAIGDEFDTLDRKEDVISADVLDAWFDPAPAVVRTLAEHLAFSLKTSPPAGCEGMQRVIARARGVSDESILPGAGSSDLIYAGLRHWITPRSRVLILDPMYGEYAHVLEQTIGVKVERFTLSRTHRYDVDCDALAARLSRGYDWVVLVNPNSPTGRHVARARLQRLLSEAPATTRFWIDETYVEYAGADQSLEGYAASSRNVVVCKSLSKVYALSGVRAAYLCGHPHLIDDLRPTCPPWSVSLPGQIAACEALRATDYYRHRWQETHRLRGDLQSGLEHLGWDVVPGCANFLLGHLPANGPDSTGLIRQARDRSLFLRDVSNMGTGFDRWALRIAVKDEPTNARMLGILRELSRSHGPPHREDQVLHGRSPRTDTAPAGRS